MKILIAGGTGFVGRSLTKALAEKGHLLTILTRDASRWQPLARNISLLPYNCPEQEPWKRAVSAHPVIINLSGASIFRFWNKKGKTEIYNSRILTTRHLVDALDDFPQPDTQLFNFSGVGYYGFGVDEMLTEDDPPGHDFLAQVARDWESEALRAAEFGARVVLCRLGHVLGKNGGVLKKLLTLSRSHLGGHWGDGRQWFSWIHEADITRVMLFLLKKQNMEGPVNLATQCPVRNREFLETLNRLTGSQPLFPQIPPWVLHTLMGELSNLFLTGQRVSPVKLDERGFVFQHPSLENALKSLIGEDQ
jgi:uncharacterized protein (TIGR01777 family)